MQLGCYTYLAVFTHLYTKYDFAFSTNVLKQQMPSHFKPTVVRLISNATLHLHDIETRETHRL